MAAADAIEHAARRASGRPASRGRCSPVRHSSAARRAPCVRVLAGGPALPPGRRAHATATATCVANVETFAQTAVLIRTRRPRVRRHRHAARTGHGTAQRRRGGRPPGRGRGAAGHAARHPVARSGRGRCRVRRRGRLPRRWLRPAPDIPLSRAGIAAAGASLGAGVLFVLDSTTCALGELARSTAWLAAQSAGQCGPCRFGLPALAADVIAAAHGDPRGLAEAQRHSELVTGRGACAHPDGTARFVASGLAVLHDEIVAHRTGGCGRIDRGQLPTGAF